MLEEAQKAVQAFHKSAGFSLPTEPTLLPDDRVSLRIKWMYEELEELRAATTIVDQADAIADIIYFALGTFEEMHVDASTIFRFVHEANMRKFNTEGEALRNAEGKVTKPADWKSPQEQIIDWLNHYPAHEELE